MSQRIDTYRRGIAGAFKGGWEIETNWTNPFTYLVFLLLRPIGGALILVAIYQVAVGGPLNTSVVGYLVVGGAMWSFVITMLQGISFTIVHEREWLRVLKYVAAAPLPLPLYVLARSAVRLVAGIFAAGVILIVTTLAFDLPIRLSAIDWPLLAVAMPLGLIAIGAMGLAVAGITMSVARFVMGISEGVAGVLYLLTGAVFPPSILPDWLERVAYGLPLTYWLEACRRALLEGYDPAFSGVGDPLVPLIVTTTATVAVGAMTFVFFDRVTRTKGYYDRTTEF